MSETEHKPLDPPYVVGASPGATYRVIVRTEAGYVAVRRISGIIYRVRVERFDHAVLFNPNDEYTINKLISVRMSVADGGCRISGLAAGDRSLERAISILTSILLDKSFKGTDLEIQPEPQAKDFEKHLEECKGCSGFHMLNESKEAEAQKEVAETPMICPVPSDSESNN